LWGFSSAAAAIPEPATILLIGTGLVDFSGTRIRKKFKKWNKRGFLILTFYFSTHVYLSNIKI
jgi:hypothetical protein